MNLRYPRSLHLLTLSIFALAALLILGALPQHAAPQSHSDEILLEIDPAKSKVLWTLDTTFHTVHGTFVLKKGTMRVNLVTGRATGEIILDATSGNSGDAARDKKMHKDVLESSRYADIAFRPDGIVGKIQQEVRSSVQVHGVFVLHGSEHEMNVPVQVEFKPGGWTASSKFNVPFIDWGLKNPSNFFAKVKHDVEIELDLTGSLRE